MHYAYRLRMRMVSRRTPQSRTAHDYTYDYMRLRIYMLQAFRKISFFAKKLSFFVKHQIFVRDRHFRKSLGSFRKRAEFTKNLRCIINIPKQVTNDTPDCYIKNYHIISIKNSILNGPIIHSYFSFFVFRQTTIERFLPILCTLKLFHWLYHNYIIALWILTSLFLPLPIYFSRRDFTPGVAS